MLKHLKRFYWRCRSAVTGKFVSKAEADANPRETVCKRVFSDEGDA